MTVNDEKLIRKASLIHWSVWSEIDELIAKADSDEAKKKLKSIQVSKYRREEYYSCGYL